VPPFSWDVLFNNVYVPTPFGQERSESHAPRALASLVISAAQFWCGATSPVQSVFSLGGQLSDGTYVATGSFEVLKEIGETNVKA